jgi:hypothetical protein
MKQVQEKVQAQALPSLRPFALVEHHQRMDL